MAASPTSEPTDVFTTGEVLNDTYEVRGVLGRGGTGQVFEAQDSALNRRVAIKVAWPHIPAMAIRKEAQALAAVRHSSVVTVHAVGTHRGLEYVVMERLYGTSLEAHLMREEDDYDLMELAEVLTILKRITEGLVAVHRAGIAHRDIKPANIILANDRVALVDFGLVLAEFDVANQASIVGSPLYMAPEVISKAVEPGAGHLVDLYSLGIVAFEMLTGETPFTGDSVRAVLKCHLHEDPPDITEWRNDVPAKMLALVRGLLSKIPSERPQSAEAVLWMLENIARPKSPRAEPLDVLVVDDDEHIAKVLVFYVKKTAPDAIVRTAVDGESALKSILEKPPDMMLLDLNMPKLTGIEVCMILRGTPNAERCSIVAVSAGAQESDVQLLRQLGVTTFIEKGASLGEQVAEVTRALQERIRA